MVSDERQVEDLKERIKRLDKDKRKYRALSGNIDLLITRFFKAGAPDTRVKDITKEMRDLYDSANQKIQDAYKQIATVVGKLSLKMDALESAIWRIEHK